jgi:hypothetical protein
MNNNNLVINWGIILILILILILIPNKCPGFIVPLYLHVSIITQK